MTFLFEFTGRVIIRANSLAEGVGKLFADCPSQEFSKLTVREIPPPKFDRQLLPELPVNQVNGTRKPVK